MLKVRHIQLLRWLARIIPLKYKLNRLISRYLNSDTLVLIPYLEDYGIVIQPSIRNQRTISDLIFEGPGYLPEFSLVKNLRNGLRPGFIYVDVGANIGTTIWLFAGKASQIVAFEPIPNLFNTIRKSVIANGVTHVDLRQLAIGDKVGTVKMGDNDNSSIVTIGDPDSLEIQISTLDMELSNRSVIDLIKIDVEGFELRVLKGARKLLSIHKPLLLIEVHPGFLKQYGDSMVELLSFLDDCEYSVSYYSFLHAQRLSRWRRVLARYRKAEIKFQSREDFLADISRAPELLSYHLYCAPLK